MFMSIRLRLWRKRMETPSRDAIGTMNVKLVPSPEEYEPILQKTGRHHSHETPVCVVKCGG